MWGKHVVSAGRSNFAIHPPSTTREAAGDLRPVYDLIIDANFCLKLMETEVSDYISHHRRDGMGPME